MAVWGVVPVKERDRAKERLAPLLKPAVRKALALAMLEDVLAALAATARLAGVIVVTVDRGAGQLARRYGARIVAEGARGGHTGAVTATARMLAADPDIAMLTLPGDIPLVTSGEIEQIITAHHAAPSFTIVPSHDEGGSNAILVSPPDAVPLCFGVNSFFPHLRAAEERGICPTVLRLPGIALDIDNPEDLAVLMQRPLSTRTQTLLAANLTPARPLAAARF
ncbi:MAG: 2-phospho-L-lactate guanylyltransferase [Alphaproteobacteria bacterium]|nr:2-phospho-L-lactate guanylyltransferase [Alphaproteobacteria bacterium]